MSDADKPFGLACNEGLGPLPAPVEVARIQQPGELRITHAYTTAQIEAERARCFALGVEAGIAQERNRCRYPACVENDDERCPRWLTGECEGPNVGNEGPPQAVPLD